MRASGCGPLASVSFPSDAGSYELAALPRGTHTVAFTPDCCSFNPYSADSVVVAAGEQVLLDIPIEETLIALGDVPGFIAAAMRARQVIPDGPAPGISAGVPDLSGVWLMGADPFPQPPSALPWAQDESK